MPSASQQSVKRSSTSDLANTGPLTAESRIDVLAAISHAIHYLPSQGPISVFVHHNTLHPFEELDFEQAVLEGGNLYGCEPYLSEERYRSEFRRGRISINDLRQVLMDDLGNQADESIAGYGTRYTLRLAMLQTAIVSAPESELRWMLAETDLLKKLRPDLPQTQREQMIQHTKNWIMRHRGPQSYNTNIENGASTASLVESLIHKIGGVKKIENWSNANWEKLTVNLLWEVCGRAVANCKPVKTVKSTDQHFSLLLRDSTGFDMDRIIDEVLIRFCGSYLDQGFANWPLPHRELGFARSFAHLFTKSFTVKPAWMDGIAAKLKPLLDRPFDPLATIRDAMATMEVGEDQVEAVITHAMLALRGWTGMIWQMETNAPWLPHPIPSGTLNEYLAIRLLLQGHLLQHLASKKFACTSISQLQQKVFEAHHQGAASSKNQQTFRLFQLAENCGWNAEQIELLDEQNMRQVFDEIEQFTSVERRRVWHLAYERHYRIATLDALSIHTSRRQQYFQPNKTKTVPAYAAIFCIDDREESFRRHLEEIDPECITASAAGFFAVAMYYRGADHAHFRPLCPNIITPHHYVQEESSFSAVNVGRRRADRRRRIGRLTHQVHAGSRTVAGGWITGLLGAVATAPMVARILAPRSTAKIREMMGTWISPPATELAIERTAAQPGPEPEALGYSLDEMAGIVVRILQDTGLVKDLSPIVILFGHGSSSLNNPHESAYNCGACSGGRGGPNARAFAMMANDPRVRKLMSERGLNVPNEVRFLGAYHNTCNDRVDYYDLDLLPRSHRQLFRRIEQSINETRARNAHERARRFESAPLDLTPAEALEHVEERAEDLSQARPEYNHATNALVFVGRREWSRGLFLDRRCFVTSYDPTIDDDETTILTRILQAAIPVCAGISLEYYFSTVDSEGYGCGSKLPHNIASMIGVMTGAASDLRPGLSQQMVEIHEAMRILFVIETSPEKMLRIIDRNPGIALLVRNRWVQLAVIEPNQSNIQLYREGKFFPHVAESTELAEADSSIQWYRGQREHLEFASIADMRSAKANSTSDEYLRLAGANHE